jgi:hypothetical protein
MDMNKVLLTLDSSHVLENPDTCQLPNASRDTKIGVMLIFTLNLKQLTAVFWVVTPYGPIGGNPEDRGGMFLWDVDNHLQDHAIS